MVRGIDHLVIAVRDLAQASDDFAQAGFTVTPGGTHTGGATRNSLVGFADGSYLELIAFAEPDREQEHVWWPRFRAGEGTVDMALRSDDVAAEAARLRAAGVPNSGPIDGGREWPDGRRVGWRNLRPDAPGAPLPFVIEAPTPRELRVPSGEEAVHPLGVGGVAGVVLLAADLDRAAPAFAALLGSDGEEVAPAAGGTVRARRWDLGDSWLEVAEPAPDAADLRAHVRDKGAGPWLIALKGDGPVAGELLPDLTHGARIRVVPAG